MDVNYSNLRGFVLYTTGTENGSNEVNTENLQGISLFHYEGQFLRHSFLKKNLNDDFENVNELSALSAGGYYEEINFAIYMSGIFRVHNNLIMYSSQNNSVYSHKTLADPNNPNSDFKASKQLLQKRAMTIGTMVKLDKAPSQNELDDLSMLYNSYRVACCNHGYYQPISIFIQEIPEPPYPGEGPGNGGGSDETDPYDPPICPKRSAERTAGSNYITSDDLAYEIRDGVLYNNFFGLKYIEYYYNTSFYDCKFDTSDAIKIASLLPKIYSLHTNYKNNKNSKVVFDDDFKNDIIDICESLKSKNSNNANLTVILNDVENDVSFLHNKSIQKLNEILY